MTIQNRPVQGGARIPVIASNDQDSSGAILPFTIILASPLDPDTGAIVTIDTIHNEVHRGEMWHGEYTFASVANGNNADLRLLTGAQELHFDADVTVTGQATVTLYEAANISAGTAITLRNRRRLSGDLNPPYTLTHTPTVTATGATALIPGRIIPGGSNPTTRVGASTRPDVEWELLPNTEYLLRINNSSGGAIIVTVDIDAYGD